MLHAADKTIGNRIDDTTGGNSGVEPRLGVMYTEMVARRGYSLSRYVDLVSTNAAKIMGLYPRKGAIAVGSDADIAMLDPTRRGKVRAADLHETDYTPWEGHDIVAWPVVTILRGKVMVENGQYFGSAERRPAISSARSGRNPATDRCCERHANSDRLRELLAQSLARLARDRQRRARGDGALVIAAAQTTFEIERAPPDLPFRWMVTVDGRRRGAISLVAVLRQVQGGARPRLSGKPRARRCRSAGAVA